VALVERESHVGGAGLNTGTIPSKALRESALLISGCRARKLLGVDLSLRRECTVADLTRHEVDVRDAMRGQTETRMRERRVEVLHGNAAFADSHTIRVLQQTGRETLLVGHKILVATGSVPVRPPRQQDQRAGSRCRRIDSGQARPASGE
jgi:NAD(P) transhydrogenase